MLGSPKCGCHARSGLAQPPAPRDMRPCPRPPPLPLITLPLPRVAAPPPCTQFSLVSPGFLFNATAYSIANALRFVNVTSYDPNSYDTKPAELTIYGPGCIFYGAPCSWSYAFPNFYFQHTNMTDYETIYSPVPTLALLCSGDAGLGLSTNLFVLGASRYNPTQEPTKDSLVKFQASRSAAAACDKIKGLFQSMSGTASTAAKASAKAAVADPALQLDCNVTFKATKTSTTKVGGLAPLAGGGGRQGALSIQPA